MSFSTLEVASARPSTSPTIAGPAPSVAVRKIGNSGVIISLDASFSSETNPRTTTVRGNADDIGTPGSAGGSGFSRIRFQLNIPYRIWTADEAKLEPGIEPPALHAIASMITITHKDMP